MSHYCPSCGTPLQPDAHFCEECGHRLDVPGQPGQQVPLGDQPTQVLPLPMQPPAPAPVAAAAGGPGDSGNRTMMIVTLVLVAVVAVAALGTLVFVMVRGGTSTTTAQDGTVSATPTPTPTVTKTEKPKPNPTVTVTRLAIPDLGDRSGYTMPSNYKSCDVGVYANQVTSCGFAINVASAWYSSGGSTFLSGVYSPATGQYYDMSCSNTLPARCTGGNDASVVIDYMP